MFFRQLLNDDTACASYVLGCKTHSQFAVVDPHVDLVDEYIRIADAQGIPIVAVFETHVQADHVSGLPELVARTGAKAYLPDRANVEFDQVLLVGQGENVKIGSPFLSGGKVVATVQGHGKGDKVRIVKFRRRKHYLRQGTHRQPYTEVKVTSIVG